MRAFHAPCTVPLMTFQTLVVGIRSGYKFTWEGSKVFNFRDLMVKMFAVAMLLSLLALTCATEAGVAPSLHGARRPSSRRGLRVSSCTAAPWEAPAFLGSSLEVVGASAHILFGVGSSSSTWAVSPLPVAGSLNTTLIDPELSSWLQYALHVCVCL